MIIQYLSPRIRQDSTLRLLQRNTLREFVDKKVGLNHHHDAMIFKAMWRMQWLHSTCMSSYMQICERVCV